MTQIYILFQERFREAMLTGRKILTTRTKCYGQPGDTFLAWGQEFCLKWVRAILLGDVVLDWKDEGCSSAEDFKRVWVKLHPRKGWTPHEGVWVHCFCKL